MAESFNTVFRVDTARASFVLRIGPQRRLHPVDAVQAEAAWTRQLATHGLPVPQLVPASGGATAVYVDGHECSLWTWLPGRSPATVDIAALAELSAQLHDASPPLRAAPPGAADGRSVLWFDIPDRLGELPPPQRAVLAAARDRAQSAIDQLWQRAGTPPRLVHADLTPSNVVEHGGRLAAIDFQDLGWAHVEQDLAHSIYGVSREADLAGGLAAFRAGYERVRPWPGLDLALLTELVAARRVAMVNIAILRERASLDAYVSRHADALRTIAH